MNSNGNALVRREQTLQALCVRRAQMEADIAEDGGRAASTG
jgi:hypothetical protein